MSELAERPRRALWRLELYGPDPGCEPFLRDFFTKVVCNNDYRDFFTKVVCNNDYRVFFTKVVCNNDYRDLFTKVVVTITIQAMSKDM